MANLLTYTFNLAPNPGDTARPASQILPPSGTAGLSRNGGDVAIVAFNVARHDLEEALGEDGEYVNTTAKGDPI